MILMAADYVGYKITEYLCKKKESIKVFVYDTKNRGGYNDDMLHLVKSNFPEIKIYTNEMIKEKKIRDEIKSMNLSLGILAWWPYILDSETISLTKRGFINTHPGYLPYNKGKHPYFWSIVEGTKFGVTVHYVDSNIDNGDIIAQKEIPINWTDTGESLYLASRDAMIQLFCENFDAVKKNEIVPIRQNEQEGTFHYGKELEPFCEIKLDQQYYARDLLNILRGRMFNEKGEAYFCDGGKKYSVSIRIDESGEK